MAIYCPLWEYTDQSWHLCLPFFPFSLFCVHWNPTSLLPPLCASFLIGHEWVVEWTWIQAPPLPQRSLQRRGRGWYSSRSHQGVRLKVASWIWVMPRLTIPGTRFVACTLSLPWWLLLALNKGSVSSVAGQFAFLFIAESWLFNFNV